MQHQISHRANPSTQALSIPWHQWLTSSKLPQNKEHMTVKYNHLQYTNIFPLYKGAPKHFRQRPIHINQL